eukprot:TRINITY_DN27155_c0_g1_i1.p1 TRINITY_DN27155_c0_g1~~TRINITY_DN27155_c0_g1_i1.p1  ORF type:complete len:259 (-),score=74.27 TRINITY_DN27155_c0_g1_i1:226-1002(-)
MAGFIEVVPHRMKGVNAKRDPLLDDKLGSSKREKRNDGTDMAYYKETAAERAERLKQEKKAEKLARKGLSAGTEPQPVANTEDEPMPKKRKGSAALLNPFKIGSNPKGRGEKQVDGFKERLQASQLATDAEAAEKRHKEDKKAADEEVLENNKKKEKSLGELLAEKNARDTPDDDKRLGFNDIWQEGDEEGDTDWLNGNGLKFHTTADKAFSMDQKKFKEATDSSKGTAQNREAVAEQAKRQSEIRMADFRHNKPGKR